MSNKTDPNGRGNQLKGIAQPSMDMTAKGVKIKVSSVHSKSNQPAIVGTNLEVMSIRKRKKKSVESIRRLPNNTERPHCMTQILKTKRERLILRTVAAVQEINASSTNGE